jgi:hypothetical protein
MIKTHEQPWYVAGPMSGLPQFNVPAFLEAQKMFEDRGFPVQLPADLDDPKIVKQLLQSEDGAHNPDQTGGLTWGDCLALDVKLISDKCHGVAVLPGWNRSRGARLETFVAALNDKPIVYASTMHKVPRKTLIRAWMTVAP